MSTSPRPARIYRHHENQLLIKPNQRLKFQLLYFFATFVAFIIGRYIAGEVSYDIAKAINNSDNYLVSEGSLYLAIFFAIATMSMIAAQWLVLLIYAEFKLDWFIVNLVIVSGRECL